MVADMLSSAKPKLEDLKIINHGKINKIISTKIKVSLVYSEYAQNSQKKVLYIRFTFLIIAII